MNMKKRKPIVKSLSALLLFLVLALPCSVWAQDSGDSQSRSLFAMDTYMTLTAYGSRAAEALDAAEEEILRLDDLLSTEKEDSEISMLNRTGDRKSVV